MKTTIGFLACIVAFCFIPIMQSSAQDKFPKPAFTPKLPGQPLSGAPRYRIAGKRASQYTAEDWGTVIDSTWGPGQTAAEQLNVFDTFWNTVDQQWSGFPNLNLNWDSMRTVYRPQIGSGLSRGRFYALMSRMWLALLEHHTWIYDGKVDSIFITGTTWQYKSGVPLLTIGTGSWDLIGAPVTPMPDSSLLVYRIDPGNPLGLEPGDLVLGYEGIPWKRLYGQLLDNGVPVSSLWSSQGSTPESRTHEVLSAVGENWGLFDTIDVVKYSTGDTLHLPTAPLATLTQSVWATDQVPIAGVPMPQDDIIWGTGAVSWGVVQGTNIGYVYAWDWGTSTPQPFHDAIYDLLNNKKVNGLVIDFRTNWGGDPSYANGGLSQLFNFDPTSNMSFATRNNSSNHLGFSISSSLGSVTSFAPTANLFDRPIAVLIGPACVSAGDWNAFRMRFHPMARFFGKPTNGAFIAGQVNGTIPDAWWYQIPTGIVYSNVPGEGYMIHKGVQPDEEVWLTRDGVAKGEDDVVERALAWITTLTYAHDVTIDRLYARPHLDSISVTATLANPLNHTAALSAIVTDSGGVVRDSISLFNDGMHGDGVAGDSVWGCRIPAPSDEGLFKICVRTDDITQGNFRKLPHWFATAGPLTLDSVAFKKSGTTKYLVTPYVRNNGSSFTVHDATVTLLCNDTSVTNIDQTPLSLPDLPPGATKATSLMITITYNKAAHPTYFNLKAEMAVNGYIYWTDSTKLVVTGVGKEEALPTAYALSQNFPNPFNPATVISYQLPVSSHVTLKIYDILGREVATLVNGKQNAGYYHATFNPANLSSGVYFYRMQAGDFFQTKKLMILK